MHAATLGGFAGGKVRMRYSFKHPAKTDVAGTRRLVHAARDAGVAHLVYVSIVGIDRVQFGYFKHKLQAEQIVAGCGVPFTITRATQFHEFVDAVIRYSVRFPMPVLTRDWRTQPIEAGDAAALIAGHAAAKPVGGIVDYGGPETMTLGEAADVWLEARGDRRRIRNVRVPGRRSRALGDGVMCTANRSGTITWHEWLRAHAKEES